ncbi:MAG TPA: hypothetical protein ACFCUC_17785 [Desulfobacterales bacterium]
MQVTCFCFDWNDVLKRHDAQAIVDEMILTDDIDLYAKDIPEWVWFSDSHNQYFSVAEALSELIPVASADIRPALESITQIISIGETIDELGIQPLTEGCYFISMSPNRVSEMHQAFNSIDFTTLGDLFTKNRSNSSAKSLPNVDSDFLAYLKQWHEALKFAHDNSFGFIGHVG